MNGDTKVKKLPLPSDAALCRLIEAARREDRAEDAKTLTMKLKYAQMARSAMSFEVEE